MKRNTSFWAALLGVMIAANAALAAVPIPFNVRVKGYLKVKGDTTLEKNLDVLGDTTLEKNLDVLGDTTLEKKLDVLGDTTLKNTSVNGTLGVTGKTTLGELSAGASTLDSLGVTNNASVGGTLDVVGKTTLGELSAGASTLDSLTVNNASLLKGNVTMEKKLTVKGKATFKKNVTMEKDLSVAGTSNLHDTNVDGALDVTGDSSLHGNVVADKKLTVGGASLLKGDVTMEKKLTVKGAATFNDNVAMARDLSVAGTSNLRDTNVDGALTVTGGATVGQNLTVGGNSLLHGTLDVGGFATFHGGASMGGKRLLEVADGRIERWSQDAVNGGQMWEMNRRLGEDIRNAGSRSAALAGLHPLDYDPNAPTSVAAAIGNYRGDTSLALGINHYFSEDVLLSLGGTIDKQPMVNLGISFRLGRDATKVSSRRQLRKELNEKDALLLSLLRRVEKLEQERQ